MISRIPGVPGIRNFGRYTNWGLRREVQSFLDEHAEYLPQGWEEPGQRSNWGGWLATLSGGGIWGGGKNHQKKPNDPTDCFFFVGNYTELPKSIQGCRTSQLAYMVDGKTSHKIQHSFLSSFNHHLKNDWIWLDMTDWGSPSLKMQNSEPSFRRIAPYQPPHRWRSCQHRNAAEQDDARLWDWGKPWNVSSIHFLCINDRWWFLKFFSVFFCWGRLHVSPFWRHVFLVEAIAEAGWILGWSSDKIGTRIAVGFLVLKAVEMKHDHSNRLLHNPPPHEKQDHNVWGPRQKHLIWGPPISLQVQRS